MNSNLTGMAIELLYMDQYFNNRYSSHNYNLTNFTLHTFEQTWGNTSGGFQGIGGCAMTTQRTYVFVPNLINDTNDCLVFFAGNFAYKVPKSKEFLNDVMKQNIAGKMEYEKRYLK